MDRGTLEGFEHFRFVWHHEWTNGAESLSVFVNTLSHTQDTLEKRQALTKCYSIVLRFLHMLLHRQRSIQPFERSLSSVFLHPSNGTTKLRY